MRAQASAQPQPWPAWVLRRRAPQLSVLWCGGVGTKTFARDTRGFRSNEESERERGHERTGALSYRAHSAGGCTRLKQPGDCHKHHRDDPRGARLSVGSHPCRRELNGSLGRTPKGAGAHPTGQKAGRSVGMDFPCLRNKTRKSKFLLAPTTEKRKIEIKNRN